MILFAFAAAACELAFRQGWVRRFGSLRTKQEPPKAA